MWEMYNPWFTFNLYVAGFSFNQLDKFIFIQVKTQSRTKNFAKYVWIIQSTVSCLNVGICVRVQGVGNKWPNARFVDSMLSG